MWSLWESLGIEVNTLKRWDQSGTSDGVYSKMGLRKWQKTRHVGVRFREHSERKHGVNYDRYFSI